MRKLALPLLGAGLIPDALFVQLRAMYDSDVSDHEIHDLIAWAAAKNPQPCGYGRRDRNLPTQSFRQLVTSQRITAKQATANARNWLCDFRCDEWDIWHVSPWRPLEDWRLDGLMLFSALYDKEDSINIVTDFTIEQQKDGKQKANPHGAGKTLLRNDWMRSIRDHSTQQSEAGAWIRPNPVKQRGSGKGGAFCDADVASYRFCILESDDLPLDLQLSVWASLPLPIAAIIDSGGRSFHAWVLVNCATAEEYEAKVSRIYALLARFGLCQSNKNPSRLSRLPGAQREIGRGKGGGQKLLYLNPEPVEAPIFERRD